MRVPSYAIFEPETGVLEVYQLDDSGQYQLQKPDADDRHFIANMNLFLGVWQGTRENRTGFWLRWWDGESRLLWRSELVEQERQRAEQERQRADSLAAQLRAAGIEPEA